MGAPRRPVGRTEPTQIPTACLGTTWLRRARTRPLGVNLIHRSGNRAAEARRRRSYFLAFFSAAAIKSLA
jgi:hypothetical protein